MKPGDWIWVRVFKSGGVPYRAWRPIVESVTDDCIVVYSAPGNPLHEVTQTFALEHHFRTYFWPGRRHTLLEIYEPDGRLRELYADITGPIAVVGEEIHLTDHELDVSMMAGGEPFIVDQDEFAEAAERYGYTDEFVRESYALAEQLRDVLANWRPLGIPSLFSAEDPIP
jgi:predicted RNA-binding protein associated with RNAse of E/G family